MDHLPREIAAELPRETAEARTFSEEEHTAILADRITRETAEIATEKAALEAQVETLTTEKAELQTKLDASEVAKAAVETEFANYKADLEAKAEIAARTDERVAKVREAAAHMADDWFTEDRAQTWAAMEQAAFDGYVAELAQVSAGLVGAKESTQEKAGKRETAAAGASAGGDKKGSSSFWSTHTKGGN